MVRPLPKLEPDNDAVLGASYNPLRIAVSILCRCLACLFPPLTTLRIASRLVPLLVCLSLIPLILLFSLFSGLYIWKNIPVSWQVPVYLQYGDSPSPYAELSLPVLSAAQPYDISLQLILPASEANFALGNFMTTLSLSTLSNKTLVTVSRAAIALPPKRATLSFFAIPRLIDLQVPLLSSHVLGTSKVNARIDIGRKDGWKGLGNGVGRELSVSDAALSGVVRHRGIWGLVSRFPFTFALVASTAFFSLSAIVLAACILPAVQRPVSPDETSSVSEPRENRHIRVRKRSRRNVAAESRVINTAFKPEDTPVDIPPALASDSLSVKR